MPRAIVMTAERETATLLMRRIRAQRGGAEKIAQALSLTSKTVRDWETLPFCYLARFNASFGNRPRNYKIVPSPRVVPIDRIRRTCLCCGARFVADGRFLRLCKPCRGRC